MAVNDQPIAAIRFDPEGLRGYLVELNGADSRDPDGDRLSFRWSVVGQPGGSRVRFSDPEAVQTVLQVDREGRYEVQLIVHDGQVESLPARVVIQFRN